MDRLKPAPIPLLVDVPALRHRLAILHHALDRAIYWTERLRLRQDIEEAQADLRAALDAQRAPAPERSAP